VCRGLSRTLLGQEGCGTIPFIDERFLLGKVGAADRGRLEAMRFKFGQRLKRPLAQPPRRQAHAASTDFGYFEGDPRTCAGRTSEWRQAEHRETRKSSATQRTVDWNGQETSEENKERV
jgi:hypothetical protein